MIPDIPHYIPQFIWKFWLSNLGQTSHVLCDPRIHVYDVYENELSEIHRVPQQTRSIFQDFDDLALDAASRSLLSASELAFTHLENEVEATLSSLIKTAISHGDTRNKSIPADRHQVEDLRKFFVFLHFRNSSKYREIVEASREPAHDLDVDDGTILQQLEYRPFFLQIRRRIILREFLSFLQHNSDLAAVNRSQKFHASRTATANPHLQTINQYCWRFCEAEVCIGIASEDQEFMLTDSCFGTLDEGFEENPECCDFFFPIIPTLALYVLAEQAQKPASSNRGITDSHSNRSAVWIETGIESPSDIHLRNAMILQTYPRRLYFSALRSVAQSVSSYDEFRWIPEHLDYSRLKQRCRQKYLQETVTKTLVVKGSIIVTDLTDEVVRVGNSAVAHGSFSDVWKGVWNDPVERRQRAVAIKFLRQVMVQNVRERLLRRLQDEVIAWHRLHHRNVSQLYGVVQSLNTIGMVSPWCENGTISEFVKCNLTADRLKLLIQVSSGVAYLHSFDPAIVHGDLKGGNILIDEHGQAIITDFGLSKVMEDMSDEMRIGSSFFAGSTRWMAPELILALVEDDGQSPQVTTFSDVYAFASVCLEIASDQLPYPHRSNDHAVTVDIMRGVKPSRGASFHIQFRNGKGEEDAFWDMLDRCWEQAWCLRPSMDEVTRFLEGLACPVGYAGSSWRC